MKPICLKLTASSVAAAEAELARHLPGLDVQLFNYLPGRVLMPPHLLKALQIEYGADQSSSLLDLAGLSELETLTWKHVIRWAQKSSREFEDRPRAVQPLDAIDVPDWHLTMCKVQGAWARLGGPDNLDWGDIRLGQIDTGYTLHPVFGFPDEAWLDVKAARTFMKDPPPGQGLDPLTGASGGHGTTSASICAGRLLGAYAGVAPRVPIVTARINDCVIIDHREQQFEAAVRYLVDDAKVSVINVSMGTFLTMTEPRAMKRALDYCYHRGVILVGAAGNVPAPWRAYPAAIDRAIAVAGVTRDAVPWSLSTYGPWVDFSAPAKHVMRATTTKSTNGYEFGFTDNGFGTTFAAAMTSGAAALWLLAHAKAIRKSYAKPWQRIEAFRLMARRTATVPTNWEPDRGFGAGILNVQCLTDPVWLPDAHELGAR